MDSVTSRQKPRASYILGSNDSYYVSLIIKRMIKVIIWGLISKTEISMGLNLNFEISRVSFTTSQSLESFRKEKTYLHFLTSILSISPIKIWHVSNLTHQHLSPPIHLSTSPFPNSSLSFPNPILKKKKFSKTKKIKKTPPKLQKNFFQKKKKEKKTTTTTTAME